ncbi:TetR/AcrR family transcriptional regulator|uniref:TetR/AcrR family transcriptional regulator n=1 Tax=Pseudomonas sp. SbOxS1 TaxID=2723884 RepID=UPI0015D30CA8|nr:TetR/AcrR family transcriptional regulator [Pseudomonas sp. SbOxS1]NYU04917.1 TetR/AcrR family transcriptional regulator [Pseudomonas sp. SbOxS1]
MLAIDASTHSPLSARDRLVHAAVELFATHGFQAIGLRDLAAHLGLQAGSLYHHIENKQCLLFELIESALSDLLTITRRRMKGAKTPAERVRRFVQAFVSFTLNEKHRLILVTREFVNLNETHKHHADKLKRAHHAMLSDIIAGEHELKNKPYAETCLITHAVMGMLYGQLHWNELKITEQHLTELLTGCVMRMIASSKEDSRQATY